LSLAGARREENDDGDGDDDDHETVKNSFTRCCNVKFLQTNFALLDLVPERERGNLFSCNESKNINGRGILTSELIKMKRIIFSHPTKPSAHTHSHSFGHVRFQIQ
jgi:hypothetical protein